MKKEIIKECLRHHLEDGFFMDFLLSEGYKPKDDAADNICSEQDFEKGLDLIAESYFNMQE